MFHGLSFILCRRGTEALLLAALFSVHLAVLFAGARALAPDHAITITVGLWPLIVLVMLVEGLLFVVAVDFWLTVCRKKLVKKIDDSGPMFELAAESCRKDMMKLLRLAADILVTAIFPAFSWWMLPPELGVVFLVMTVGMFFVSAIAAAWAVYFARMAQVWQEDCM